MSTTQPQNFDELVSQAQIAHRLLAGFYQRLLPLIQQVAKQLDVSFYEWEPTVTHRPSRKNSDPADAWAWNMLPLLAHTQRFMRSANVHATKGDVVLDCFFSFDSHFSHDPWSAWNVPKDNEPDATSRPLGQALVEVALGRCEKDHKVDLQKLWGEADDLSEDEQLIGLWQNIGTHFNAVNIKMPMTEFLANPQALVDTVKALLAQPGPELAKLSD